LDTVIQNNASASEEMAATSEELAGQADQMQQTIGYFKLAQRESEEPGTRPEKGAKDRRSCALES